MCERGSQPSRSRRHFLLGSALVTLAALVVMQSGETLGLVKFITMSTFGAALILIGIRERSRGRMPVVSRKAQAIAAVLAVALAAITLTGLLTGTRWLWLLAMAIMEFGALSLIVIAISGRVRQHR
jgi:hypothetical protein